MAAPLVLDGVDKMPYVLLERLGVQPPRDHAQRIPLADRNPVVLLQRLPLDPPGEDAEVGENGSRLSPPPPTPSASEDGGEDSPRGSRKRSPTPPPPLTPRSTAGTPSKRIRFNRDGSGHLSARRQLWARQQHESVTPTLKSKSSATKENLSVLLGVKSSRGVPIVSLERLKLDRGCLKLDRGYPLAGSLAGDSPTSRHNEGTAVEEGPSSSTTKNNEPPGPGRRAAALSSCPQTDSSDDN